MSGGACLAEAPLDSFQLVGRASLEDPSLLLNGEQILPSSGLNLDLIHPPPFKRALQKIVFSQLPCRGPLPLPTFLFPSFHLFPPLAPQKRRRSSYGRCRQTLPTGWARNGSFVLFAH